ncbi:hypothetical protein [Epibacterium ulvae]|uniref:hypothetical protein n=1 Tax=Epibacterium ulvae TaxID=1156985 RepID=UPI0024900563|nr:hypothetical protein [Epibacterium ulvae]
MFETHEYELLLELVASGVEFVVIGGAAVNVHEVARGRDDLDLLFEPSRENLSRLEGIRFGTHTMKREEVDRFIREDGAIQRIDFNGRFDLLKETLAVPMHEVFRNAIRIPVNDLIVHVISKEHLIAEKEASATTLDKEDVSKLREMGASN